MLFSGIPFLYYFLPAVLLLYFAVPHRLKNPILLIFSLIFYGWGEPRYILLMLISILSGYAFALAIEKKRNTLSGKILTFISIGISLSFLLVFKYADFIIENINAILNTDMKLIGLSLPVGISFYTFQIVSYTIDVYREDTKAQKDPIAFGMYVSLFPQLIAGPIVRYTDIEKQIQTRKHSIEQASYGIQRFIIGLSKKVLIANLMGDLVTICEKSSEQTIILSWIYAAALVFQIYFDFSGYSDMAIGLGSIFGFYFPENFKYPLISRSVQEFWRRWHISLGTWFRDYVYIPLGGSRTTKARYIRNIAVVWMLTGLWHGASWNFVIWGAGFGILLLSERFLTGKLLEKLPHIVSHAYMIVIMTVSFTLFSSNSLNQAFVNIRNMFGLGGIELLSSQTIYVLKSHAVLLIAATFASTPAGALIYKKVEKSKAGNILMWITPIVLAALLIIASAFLADGSYNPFLYFRF